MRKWFNILAIFALLGSFVITSSVSAQNVVDDATGGENYAPGQILIGLKHKPTVDGMAQFSSALGADVRAVQPDINLLVMRVEVGDEVKALERARQNPDVAFAELDYIAHAAESPAAVWPNDPGLSVQWALEKMGMPFAWDYSQGSPTMLVAVLDTGVQLNHPDLLGQIWTNPGETPGNDEDDDGNGKKDDVHGWHFYHVEDESGDYVQTGDGNVADDNGHGTRVTGIITAKANNGLGIAGVSSASQVLPVKVLDHSGRGYYSDIIAGIKYAADQGAKIINLSLGAPMGSDALREAVDYARDHGVLVVAAAGNCLSGIANCPEPVMYPAAIDSVIAVAANDENDSWAVFSNIGPEVDLSAPGTNIVSTNLYSAYSQGDGTSFAAPQVSGVAALLWSYKPGLTLSELEDLLTGTAEDIDAPGKDVFTGWGRVSANRALGRIEELADPWVDCHYEHGVLNQEPRFVVLYGNSGYGVANEVVVTTSLSLPGELAEETTWPAVVLPAGDESDALMLSIPVEPAGGIISISVLINSTSLDFETRNNLVYCQASPGWMIFLPYLAQANVSK